jgi:hypothetical protein
MQACARTRRGLCRGQTSCTYPQYLHLREKRKEIRLATMTVGHELDEKRAPAREHLILDVQLAQQCSLATNGGTTSRSNHERLARRTEQCRDEAAGLYCLLGLPLLLSEAAGRITRARRTRLVIPGRIRRDLFI